MEGGYPRKYIMKSNYRVVADINLEAIRNNLTKMSNHVGSNKQVMAVVKADGYGHGAVAVATAVLDLPFLWGFGVATVDEAIELRKAKVSKPILVFGCVFPDEYQDLITYDITATIYTLETAILLNQVALESGSIIKAHIKVDTGMTRLGFLPTDENAHIVAKITTMPNLKIEGIYTHYAKADERELDFTYRQHQKCLNFYDNVRNLLEDNVRNLLEDKEDKKDEVNREDRVKAGDLEIVKAGTLSYFHCSNSGGIISYPDSHCHIVRAGISMYGHYPSDEVPKENVRLMPALTLTSHISYVKVVEQGTPVSYGGTYITPKPMKIATIPVGYGDGYPRSLSNVGEVLIGGKRCRILGRVCMDQFMVDVSHIPGVKMMDPVVIVGRMGDEEITVEELSDLSGRFNYEFLCCLTKRIPRRYVNH
jgi:alanine racemase